MNLTIELPDETVARLERQAMAHGISLQEWLQELACTKAQENDELTGGRNRAVSVARILDLQNFVKPDPADWTIRDYIDHGRR